MVCLFVFKESLVLYVQPSRQRGLIDGEGLPGWFGSSPSLQQGLCGKDLTATVKCVGDAFCEGGSPGLNMAADRPQPSMQPRDYLYIVSESYFEDKIFIGRV